MQERLLKKLLMNRAETKIGSIMKGLAAAKWRLKKHFRNEH
ncbi:hypothetical protein HMP0721_0007 [Pseudoramibacter alactolyticus ATCC 23263]|jgi:hypothetical protein|uniref:Uncharacterized protein n=1 Tax=Pseudoramibacter alactolyticus ATCC 23263 TaxID=887929 RepID=E6MDC5_9FIRM|nr:hypothetical protein HMP0721_0007 [Pseudoramibacter alactolyticus ATCC 23263]